VLPRTNTCCSTSLNPKRPIIATMKLRPPRRFGLPKSKRAYPRVGSIPTVENSTPMRSDTNALSDEPLEAKIPAVSPRMAIQKYSNEEKFLATAARLVAAKIRSTVPNRPPTMLPMALMPKAYFAPRRRAMPYCSSTYAAEAGVQGILATTEPTSPA